MTDAPQPKDYTNVLAYQVAKALFEVKWLKNYMPTAEMAVLERVPEVLEQQTLQLMSLVDKASLLPQEKAMPTDHEKLREAIKVARESAARMTPDHPGPFPALQQRINDHAEHLRLLADAAESTLPPEPKRRLFHPDLEWLADRIDALEKKLP